MRFSAPLPTRRPSGRPRSSRHLAPPWSSAVRSRSTCDGGWRIDATFWRGMPTDVIVGFPVSAAREHDLELARRAATGDRVAQRELFLEQRANVHRALFRILGSNREIEDLLQDAFIEIFKALGSFRGDSTLGRWCQTIAVRVAYLAISRRRPPAVELALVEETVASDVDVRRQALLREAARRLYAALDRVEAKQRISFA